MVNYSYHYTYVNNQAKSIYTSFYSAVNDSLFVIIFDRSVSDGRRKFCVSMSSWF